MNKSLGLPPPPYQNTLSLVRQNAGPFFHSKFSPKQKSPPGLQIIPAAPAGTHFMKV